MKPVLPIVFVLLGCATDDDQSARCGGELSQQLMIETTLLDGVVGSGEITVRGKLHRPDTITIYSLTIAGQLAIDEGDNFRLFSVKVPANAPVAQDGTVAVVATANCPLDGTLARLALPASTSPQAMFIAIEDVMGYRALTPAVPVSVVVRSDEASRASADGLMVEITSTLGMPMPTALTLRDAPMQPTASATAYLYPPDREGVAIVTARAGKLADTAEIVFLGPARIVPSGGSIYRDTPRELIIAWPSIGNVTATGTCTASAAPDIRSEIAAGNDRIILTPLQDAVEGHAAHVRCTDALGQISTADFVVAL